MRVDPLLLLLAVLIAAPGAQSQVTQRHSVSTQGVEADAPSAQPCLSADGRFLAFSSEAGNLVPGDQSGGMRDVFVRDLWVGTTERVSVDSLGVAGNGDSFDPSLSADGRYVAFESYATNLVPGDTNAVVDVFVHDRWTGLTERVSLGNGGGEADDSCREPILSGDGQRVVFWSLADNLVPSDNNWATDVFVRDRVAATTERVSVDSFGIEGNDASSHAAISADGSVIAFRSWATNLVPGDTNGTADIFVRDLGSGRTERVSVDSFGNQGYGWFTFDAALSGDGIYVAFTSDSDNLVANDSNQCRDVFRHDRIGGGTVLVSSSSLGDLGNDDSTWPKLSADGSAIVFQSWASNLVPNDSNALSDVYLKDFTNGLCERVSISAIGGQGHGASDDPWVSTDGRLISFLSYAPNLVPGDQNGVSDIFLHDRQSGGALLQVFNLVGGGVATVEVHGATPGAHLVLAYSLSGQGDLPYVNGLLNLQEPVSLVHRYADAQGFLSFQVPVPAGLAGAWIWGQGVDTASGLPTRTWWGQVL